MRSGGLLDDLLVVVARHVRRWTDRILAEEEHAPSPAKDDPWAGEDPSDVEPDDNAGEDGDGPPAHWLEMVRDRAPQLLDQMDFPRRAPQVTRRSVSHALQSRAASHAGVAEPPAAEAMPVERGRTAPSSAGMSIAPPPAETPVEVLAAPPVVTPADAQEGAPDEALAEPPAELSANAPATSPCLAAPARTRPHTPVSTVSREERIAAPRVLSPRDAAPASSGHAATFPLPEPPPWRWRFESTDEAPPERPPIPRRSPDSWRASVPDALSSAAPTRPVSRVAAPEASPEPTTPDWRVTQAPAPARVIPIAAPIAAVTPPGAPHQDPAPSLQDARDATSRSRWLPPLPERPAAWPSLPDEVLQVDGADHPAEVHPARPLRWPRLPDEDSPDLPVRATPAEPTWPVLPSDDLAVLEDPVSTEDLGRFDHLRREQQGTRWSERPS